MSRGFIGGHLAIGLLKQKTKNILIGSYFSDITESHLYSFLNKNPLLRKKIRFVHLDIRDKDQVSKVINENKINVLFHLAAITTVEEGLKDPYNTFLTNIVGTTNILEACRLNKNIKALIIASSDKSYGVSSKNKGYAEKQNITGICPYSSSKTSVEIIAQSYGCIYDLPIAVLRCSNIYGGGDNKETRIVPRTIKNILNGKPAVIHGDGKYIRDFLFVDDLINGYLLVLKNILKKKKSFTYNFGTGEGITCLKMISEIFKVSGKKSKLEYHVAHKGIIRKQINNPFLAKKELGWKPKTNLREGLAKTLSWYKENYVI